MGKIDKDKKDGYTDDITFEPEEMVNEEESLQDKIKKLRNALKECEAEKTEYLAGWQRAKADVVNVRREADEGRARQVQFATVRLVEDLLPVLDSFTMARADTAVWESVDTHWRKGIEQVHGQLEAILKREGLVEISSTDVPFDPMHHEAVGTVSVAEEEKDNTVVQMLQHGYQIGEKIIRPARVIVGEHH